MGDLINHGSRLVAIRRAWLALALRRIDQNAGPACLDTTQDDKYRRLATLFHEAFAWRSVYCNALLQEALQKPSMLRKTPWESLDTTDYVQACPC